MAYLAVLFILVLGIDGSDSQTTSTTPSANADDAHIMQRLPGNCTTGQFDCGEKCIPIKRFRDCHQDCADGSDEVCWPGFVRCLPTDTGCACVKTADAALLCSSRTDNKFCSLPPDNIFHCKNSNCVPKGWVNDMKNDCGDWSDEQLTALQPLH